MVFTWYVCVCTHRFDAVVLGVGVHNIGELLTNGRSLGGSDISSILSFLRGKYFIKIRLYCVRIQNRVSKSDSLGVLRKNCFRLLKSKDVL